jgi:hypothetical protein
VGTVVDEEDVAPFYVEDGSGERARVVGTGGCLSADTKVFQTLSPAALERLTLFLTGRGHTWFELLRTSQSKTAAADCPATDRENTKTAREPLVGNDSGAEIYEEECLRPGDSVTVMGLSRRGPSASGPMLYRDEHASELVIQAAPGQELIVSTPKQLRRERRGVYLAGQIIMATGVLAILAGFVAHQITPE